MNNKLNHLDDLVVLLREVLSSNPRPVKSYRLIATNNSPPLQFIKVALALVTCFGVAYILKGW